MRSFHLQPIAKKVKSYIKDTIDFLKKLHFLTNLFGNSLLCTMDVVGLSLYIPHDKVLSVLRKGLNERDKKDVSTDTLAELTELVLKSNFFNFGKTYETKKRYSSWDKVCSTLKYFIYGRIGRKILEIVDNKPYLWWRYIDDIFFI